MLTRDLGFSGEREWGGLMMAKVGSKGLLIGQTGCKVDGCVM